MRKHHYRFRISKLFVCTIVILILPLHSYPADDEAIEKAGDVLQIALPVAAGATTIILQDWEGTLQFAKAFGASWLTAYTLKYAIGKLRPASDHPLSHPSGHTMGAFAGAAFIDNRYGHAFGIPAYALAAFTGYSRVHSNNHFFDDVISGASISMLWSWFFVTPYGEEKVKSDVIVQKGKPIWRYDWAFGPALLIRNEMTAPTNGGTTFDLDDFEKRDDPTTSAVAMISVLLKEKHDLWLLINPFESRDKGYFSSPVNFQGVEFPADSLTYSAWRMEELRMGYHYHLFKSGIWDIKLGAGLTAIWTSIKLQTANEQQQAEVKDFVVLPLVNFYLGLNPFEQLAFYLSFEGISISTYRYIDLGTGLLWQFNPHWSARIAYHFIDKDIETDELINHVSYNTLIFGIGHTF